MMRFHTMAVFAISPLCAMNDNLSTAEWHEKQIEEITSSIETLFFPACAESIKKTLHLYLIHLNQIRSLANSEGVLSWNDVCVAARENNLHLLKRFVLEAAEWKDDLQTHKIKRLQTQCALIGALSGLSGILLGSIVMFLIRFA